MSQKNFTSGSVQTCLEVHAGWNAQTWRFYNLQEPRILCHIPKCPLDQSSIKHGHKSTSAIPHVLKDSCLPHHKHGTLTLEEAGRCARETGAAGKEKVGPKAPGTFEKRLNSNWASRRMSHRGHVSVCPVAFCGRVRRACPPDLT